MPNVRANGIQIEYETVGRPGGTPILLVMGLGGQLIHWPDGFCAMLADRGHLVIRFDNRDSGLSTSFDGVDPNLAGALMSIATGEPAPVPYLLDDMADDTAGLLAALAIDAVHVVGASMGGMIAQAFAIRHPARTLCLTSIMSAPEFVEPDPDMLALLGTPAPTEREASIEFSVMVDRATAGPGFPYDEAEVRRVATLAFDRNFNPEGTNRQLAAILGSKSRRAALSDVRVPTLVIHGSGDRLVPPIGGRMTAESIPGAELLVIEGMGHDLPRETWPRIVDAVSALTERAGASREARSASTGS